MKTGLTKKEIEETIKQCKRSSKLYFTAVIVNATASCLLAYYNSPKMALLFGAATCIYFLLLKGTDWLLPRLEKLAEKLNKGEVS